MPWTRTEAEIIIRGLADCNPIREHEEGSDCIFCEGHHSFSGSFARHTDECIYAAAVRLVNEIGPVPIPPQLVLSNPIESEPKIKRKRCT
jgi:hypothetical protein